MKRNFIVGFIFFIAFLVGCSREQSFNDFFQEKVKDMHKGEKNYSYSLVYTDLNVIRNGDAIAVFKEHNNQGEQIFIAYFQKKDKQWEWKHTMGSEWNSPVKWTSMTQKPYIYSGTIRDNSIVKVYAGSELAKIIKIEGDKRFWYAISPIKVVKVTQVKENGNEEIIQEINYEDLKKK
ncbi:MAG: hypothetical protein ACO1OT_07815 [Heyndrickxia sp.]